MCACMRACMRVCACMHAGVCAHERSCVLVKGSVAIHHKRMTHICSLHKTHQVTYSFKKKITHTWNDQCRIRLPIQNYSLRTNKPSTSSNLRTESRLLLSLFKIMYTMPDKEWHKATNIFLLYTFIKLPKRWAPLSIRHGTTEMIPIIIITSN